MANEAVSTKEKTKQNKPNVFDIFIEGARKGWTIGTQNLVPNIIMAYVIAYILNILGIMDFIGHWFGPVMTIFGLPGQAIVILLTTWLSCSAGVGIAASFYTQGVINEYHIAILMPALLLMASQIQYMGRLLGTADIPKKYWPMLMLISIFNAVIGMFAMKIYMAIFG
ncbi:YjiG family protein [Dialister hominis]|mgnify:FL=1|jgi:spore maturation protein SpmB|uniref:YjiG family protein n=1 Tax=Dialister hominis TaxID=2582419 RepID=UPI003A8FF225